MVCLHVYVIFYLFHSCSSCKNLVFHVRECKSFKNINEVLVFEWNLHNSRIIDNTIENCTSISYNQVKLDSFWWSITVNDFISLSLSLNASFTILDPALDISQVHSLFNLSLLRFFELFCENGLFKSWFDLLLFFMSFFFLLNLDSSRFYNDPKV